MSKPSTRASPGASSSYASDDTQTAVPSELLVAHAGSRRTVAAHDTKLHIGRSFGRLL